jgi:hypothetical protein
MNLPKVSTFRKAVAAALAGALTAVTDGLLDGGVAEINWVVVAGAALVAGFGVFRIKNKPAE